MMFDAQKVSDAEARLGELLGPEISQVTAAIRTQIEDGQHPFLILLPETDVIDETLETLASLVARSSNAYMRAARFSGMARAEAKRARGMYERKYKQSRAWGKNDAEREGHAMNVCATEHTAMVTAEAIAEVAESMEHGARVASESARKIFDKAHAMQIAQVREAHGAVRDDDFRSY